MKIQYPTGTVTQFYGRNPTYKVVGFGGGLIPHVDTIRATYNPAAGRKAVVLGGFLQLQRTTAAAPVGLVTARWQLTIPPDTLNYMRVLLTGNLVNDHEQELTAGQVFLNDTDHIECITSDSSTGGDANYFGTIYVVEFDP